MTWASPWAWLFASAAVLPLIAHLWSRRRPRAVLFPTLRFLTAASPVSRRLHHIQDWPLLLLRFVIVLAIAAAAAGPTLTAWWHPRASGGVHRVIVVDEYVEAPAAGVVARLERESAWSTVLGPGHVPVMIDDATAIAESHARRSRVEIVILWDGTHPALTPADLAVIPSRIGLRLYGLERMPPTSASSRPPVTIDAMERDAKPRRNVLALLPSLRLPAIETPLRVRWPPDTSAPQFISATISPTKLRALEDLANDARVQDAAERSTHDGRRLEHDVIKAGGMWLAQSPDGRPMLRGWFERDALVIASDATAASPLSWWAVVSPLEALVRWERLTARQERWSREEIRRVERDGVVEPLESAGLHTRAAWMAALALLLLEQWWRGRVQRRPTGERERPGVVEEHTTHVS